MYTCASLKDALPTHIVELMQNFNLRIIYELGHSSLFNTVSTSIFCIFFIDLLNKLHTSTITDLHTYTLISLAAYILKTY